MGLGGVRSLGEHLSAIEGWTGLIRPEPIRHPERVGGRFHTFRVERLHLGGVLEDHLELCPVGVELVVFEAQPGQSRDVGDIDLDGHPARVPAPRGEQGTAWLRAAYRCPMPRIAILLFLAAVLASCTPGDGSTSTSEPGSTPTSTIGATTTITEPSITTTEPARELTVITTGPKRLGLLPSGRHLDAGLDQFLGRAYDDFVGGLVFSRSGADHGVWHLEAGRQEPSLLVDGAGVDRFALLDVADPPSRPPMALVLTDDRLLLAPTTGGAPEELRIVDLAAAGSGSRFGTASLGGDLLLVAWIDGEGCALVDLFTLDGSLSTGGLFRTCEGTEPVLSDEGDLIATLERGASARMVFRAPEDGREIARWQVDATDGWIHASDGVVTFPSPRGVGVVGVNGTVEELPEVGVLLGASVSRSQPEVSDLATLGGLTALATCSTADDAPLAAQDGLTEPASDARNAIGGAMAACDLSLLGSLLAPEALADGDPSLEWWDAEAKGFPLLLTVRGVLELPFAVRDDGDRVVFVWPWIAEGSPDGDWDALTTVFNEEDIERWRSGGEPYDRLVLEITEDGEWVGAGAGG